MESDKTAIFVDGAFFIKRAARIFGHVEPDDLANKLWSYSLRPSDTQILGIFEIGLFHTQLLEIQVFRCKPNHQGVSLMI